MSSEEGVQNPFCYGCGNRREECSCKCEHPDLKNGTCLLCGDDV